MIYSSLCMHSVWCITAHHQSYVMAVHSPHRRPIQSVVAYSAGESYKVTPHVGIPTKPIGAYIPNFELIPLFMVTYVHT